MKRTWFAVLIFVAVPLTALGTTLVAMNLESLTTSSDTIVHGRIANVTAKWSGDKRRIYTEAQVEVLSTLKGLPKATVAVRQPGGEVGDIGQAVHGTAKLVQGEEVVLFLEARGEHFIVTGMAQGKLIVERPANGVATVRREAGAELSLVDPQTHQPTSSQPIRMTLEALIRRVRELGPTVPANPTSPVIPVTP